MAGGRRNDRNGDERIAEEIPDRQTEYGLLFSHRYYCMQVPELDPDNALQHFESIGWQEGISPHPLFSTAWYLKAHEFHLTENPLRHYLREGWQESASPHPLFDVVYYSEGAGIDFSAGEATPLDPLSHYLSKGCRQNISPHPLVSFYYSNRPRRPRDVQLAGVNRKAAVVEPIGFSIRNECKDLFRPHPMFCGSRLATQLKFRDQPVTPQSLTEVFVTWSAKSSPSPLFDPDFYASRYPESKDFPRGPFQHFVEIGQFDAFDPNPYFCSQFYIEQYGEHLRDAPSPFMHYMTHEATLKFKPSEEFDVAHYHGTRPEVRNSGRSLLEHFLAQGRFGSCEIHRHSIPHFLMQDIREAAVIDPSIRFSQSKLRKLKVVNRHQAIKVSDHYNVLRAELQQPFKVLVMAPFLKRGGADLVAVNLVRCLHQQFSKEDVLLVTTDGDDLSAAHWLPDGTRHVTLSHIEPTMSVRERERLLQLVIDEYRPEICYNVNSNAGWELFARQGKGLSTQTRLAAFLFCFDYRELDVPVGYAMQHFPKAFDCLEAVYLDNKAFRAELISMFGFPPSKHEKLQVVYQPTRDLGSRIDTDAILERLARDESYRRQVCWASRIDRQKRPDIMLEIARRCPQFDFHVYGTREADVKDEFESDVPVNVKFHGEFPHTFKLPLQDTDMFLYTSQWDGLPTLLIDILQAGVPTIAADTGGVRELVNEKTGWLVDSVENVDAYVAGLCEMANSPEEARVRLEAGRQLIDQQHHWETYSRLILNFVSTRST